MTDAEVIMAAVLGILLVNTVLAVLMFWLIWRIDDMMLEVKRQTYKNP